MKNLKALRSQKGLSQQKLADQLQLSQQSIYKYENDLTEPDLDTLKKMADFFDTSVDYLIGYSDDPRKLQPYSETALNATELDHIQHYRLLPEETRSLFDSLLEEFLKYLS